VGYGDVVEVVENDIVFLLWEVMADLWLIRVVSGAVLVESLGRWLRIDKHLYPLKDLSMRLDNPGCLKGRCPDCYIRFPLGRGYLCPSVTPPPTLY